MFCPNCGIEDPGHNQFCRSCGTSLNAVRTVLEQPDAITTSAVKAREEIGRVIAAKVAEFEEVHELRVAVYELLPAIQRFLESPEERQLHLQEQRSNMKRQGALTAVVGLAIMLPSLFLSWRMENQLALIAGALGMLVLLIGLGITITASWFTSSTGIAPHIKELSPQFDPSRKPNTPQSIEEARQSPYLDSVTEGTTREL